MNENLDNWRVLHDVWYYLLQTRLRRDARPVTKQKGLSNWNVPQQRESGTVARIEYHHGYI